MADEQPIPPVYIEHLLYGLRGITNLIERYLETHHVVTPGMSEGLDATLRRLDVVSGKWANAVQQGQYKPE